ncbi:hypothetical protein ElyMa_004427500 [Elysia marginata]|uniref:TNFR-Cys domain-containing protein n=1 Tax=Elysia marginata TaxID=1093978 RepID=A0AAV4HC67_9GAST|nr:hypothetical protein ElyMa_004427500 [Elysia marginata]
MTFLAGITLFALILVCPPLLCSSQLHWNVPLASQKRVECYNCSPYHKGFEFPQKRVECYNCSPYHKGFEFPQCLYIADTCDPGQKCSILYKHDAGLGLGPVIGCSEQCYQVKETPLLCLYGGGILPNWECYACCENSSCVTHATTQLSRDYFLSPKVFCPGRCHRSDLKGCMTTGVECVSSEFCIMSYDSANQMVEGWCRDANPTAVTACDAAIQSKGACPHSPKDLSRDASLSQASCLWGCLKNNVEVMVLFNHYPIHDFMTTVSP